MTLHVRIKRGLDWWSSKICGSGPVLNMIRFPDHDPTGFCNSEPDPDWSGFCKNLHRIGYGCPNCVDHCSRMLNQSFFGYIPDWIKYLDSVTGLGSDWITHWKYWTGIGSQTSSIRSTLVTTRGGRTHFIRLRLLSCLKIFESGSGNSQIWNSAHIQTPVNHRSNRKFIILHMFYIRNNHADSCYCQNWKVTPRPVSNEIYDLCEISNLLLFVSYFASLRKGIKFGDYFFDVRCVNLNFLVRFQISATSNNTGINMTTEKYWT